MKVLYNLQHLGCITPRKLMWVGLVKLARVPSYGDTFEDGTIVGESSYSTNRNTTFMTWNPMHLAKLLKDNGGILPTVTNAESVTLVADLTSKTSSR